MPLSYFAALLHEGGVHAKTEKFFLSHSCKKDIQDVI